MHGLVQRYPVLVSWLLVHAARSHPGRTGKPLFSEMATPFSYPAVTAVYRTALGLFVPSGGSKWVIEAPCVMQAAHPLKVHLWWTVASYNLGEALANLIQPFWMLPVLGLLGLRARDIMGVTFSIFLVLVPVVLVLVTALGATLSYPL